MLRVRDHKGGRELNRREESEEGRREPIAKVVIERIEMQRAVRQEQQRDDESLRPIAAQEDLVKVIESDTDRREGDPEHRHEKPKGERGRGPVPGGLGCDLEEAEEVRDPSDEDDEDPADEERKLCDARPGSLHPGRRGQREPSSFRCPTPWGTEFQKHLWPTPLTS